MARADTKGARTTHVAVMAWRQMRGMMNAVLKDCVGTLCGM